MELIRVTATNDDNNNDTPPHPPKSKLSEK